ncbi:ExbD/TolR family protein [Mucilaginibacter terrae]|uniref:Biopolymer transport protein ExbD n=1 Tax=Mucilaginibacter terrae TaxID=1955052 RepID=A0ABU3GV17_9SPHI|nr:biopolymer transporter ExbD [Mucilaginibacter terrae]MDT3402485.1 biopolymer transport protein ExbD [Mucilaginibacter terrae]
MNLRKRHKSASAEVHTSAMNDIMFFLLLFFLIASTLTNPNVIKLSLPKAAAGKTLSKRTINVSITNDFKYYIDKTPVAVENLQSALSVYKKPDTDLTIVLNTDSKVIVQDAVNVLDVAQKLNIKVVLATQPK